MKTTKFAITLFAITLSACGTLATPVPSTPTSVPATSTPTITFTPEPTLTPTATPVPGDIVIPITSMEDSIPWLKDAFDPKAKPGVMFYAFNITKPPFDNLLVRQAFAAAVDREEVAAIATRYYWQGARPATTFIPPQVLGRDLYNEIGIPFNSSLAKELLSQAGYSDPASFPKTTLYISASRSDAPGSYLKMAEAIVEMWKENLGVNVEFKSIGYVNDLASYLGSNPNGYEIYRMGFYMGTDEEIDPTFIELFHSDNDLNYGYNYAHFDNPEFDKLLNEARKESDPEKRQLLYIEAERILCETEIVLIPLYHYTVP